MNNSPAMVILGPRQVGKTTLALQVAKNNKHNCLYLDLESPPRDTLLALKTWGHKKIS